MKKIVLLTLSLILTGLIYAQDGKFGIKFTGFVKNDFFFDSRQTVAAREGHFLLWPAPEKLDPNSIDINAKSNLNFLAVQSRLTGKISGPDAFGARTSAVIEGAFFGHSNSDVNGFRLRHAYGKLNWEKTELIFGQTWNPMFVTACFPGVVSFNTGAPFQPFARNPQIKLIRTMGALKLSLTAFTQRDFTSAGGSALLRNSSLPEVHFGASYNKKGTTEVLAGLGASYKTLIPRLQTNTLFAANESVSSYITEAYLKFKCPSITFKLEGVYGQNTYDVLGISSFALVSMDPDTDHREYTALSSMSIWSELHTNGKTVQFGLFGGYTKNLGAGQEVLTTQFGTRSGIDYVYRIAPRVLFNSGKVRIATELEYTAASFGNYDIDGSVSNAVQVANMRVLVAAYYFF